MKVRSIEARVSFTFTFLLCVLMACSAGATNYTLTVIAQGSGTISKNPTNTSYPVGVTVTITATPSAGWYFANWSGDTNSTVNPLNVTMNSSMVITGNFLAYPTYSVALVTNGQGSMDLNPPGGSYLSNTMVTVTATPAAGWVFTAWSGATNSGVNPLSFVVHTNVSLTGFFAQLPALDVQPVSMTNKAGSTVNFTSDAVGSAPLGYTWYFSGGTLTNGTNATLVLTNVTMAQAGNYWVVATNNYGSATSQVATLTLTNAVGPTNVVNSPDQGSLQAAIALGGWVGIGFNGTVTLTNTINITNNVVLDGTGVAATISGGNVVRLFNVIQGASLTVSNLTLANGDCIVTNGSPGTPADGGAIYNNGTMTLVGCTLTNNSAQSLIYGGLARGGAIFNNGGTISLAQSVVTSNSCVGGGPNSFTASLTTGTGLGGAIYNTNGTLTITACTLNGNLSEGVCEMYGIGLTMGGAVCQSSGTTTVINSSLAANHASGGVGAPETYNIASPAYGGALAVTGGSLVVNQSRVLANSATGGNAGFDASGAPGFGGAVYSAGLLIVSDSSLFGNHATGGTSIDYHQIGLVDGLGGAIYNAGTAVANRCSVCSNYVQGGYVESYNGFDAATGFRGLGGGIFNASQFAATNCTIALNIAFGGGADGGSIGTCGNAIGGGVFNNTNAVFTGMNLTIASNSCSSPSGIQQTNGFAAAFQIANTNGTFRVHNALIAYSGTNSNAYGPITDDGYNICSDGSANLFSGSSYNYTDPQLAPLGNYGGPTLCMALLATSPAIDNGDPNGAPVTDQRAYLRPASDAPDMGAYEYGAVPLVIPYLNINSRGSNALLSFTAYPPSTYRLQSSTNLTSWSDLSTNGPITSQTNVSQTISEQGFSRRFFRLLMQ